MLPEYVRKLIAYAARLAASRKRVTDRRRTYLVTYMRLRRAALRSR